MNNVYINQELYNQFFKQYGNSFELGTTENCGILVGKRIEKDDFQIDYIIHDKNPPEKGPFKVFRSTKHIYPELEKIVNADLQVDYLGEWHTHPFGPSFPSLTDILTMKTMVNNPLYGEISWVLLLLITGYTQQTIILFENGEISEINLIFNN